MERQSSFCKGVKWRGTGKRGEEIRGRREARPKSFALHSRRKAVATKLSARGGGVNDTVVRRERTCRRGAKKGGGQWSYLASCWRARERWSCLASCWMVGAWGVA